jgi:hypothetical protein
MSIRTTVVVVPPVPFLYYRPQNRNRTHFWVVLHKPHLVIRSGVVRGSRCVDRVCGFRRTPWSRLHTFYDVNDDRNRDEQQEYVGDRQQHDQ